MILSEFIYNGDFPVSMEFFSENSFPSNFVCVILGLRRFRYRNFKCSLNITSSVSQKCDSEHAFNNEVSQTLSAVCSIAKFILNHVSFIYFTSIICFFVLADFTSKDIVQDLDRLLKSCGSSSAALRK